MSISITNTMKGPLVLVTQQNGVTVIPQPTPLTRLNYFDGKFLRASDLSAEQLYLRRLVDLSNQAGGPGVAHGYDLSLGTGGDTLNVGPGLAIDPEGRVLLLPQAFSIGVQELIERSRQLQSTPAAASINNGSFADCTVVAESPPGGVVQAGNLFLITIGFAEALCGEEDVFGKLCEEACATSTDRPFLVEGVVLRASPLQLQTPLPISAVVALSQLHLRSRVASSYFEDERKKVASFISGDGLRSDVWCFGAEAEGGFDVPIGVLARAGSTTLFLDAWIGRRERIDTPAKRYWQWRMAMRPSDVFLAQILQFQCQLSGLFKQQPPAGGDGDDPCASARTLIREATDTVAKIANFYQTVTTRFTLQRVLVSGIASEERPPVLEGGLTALLDFQKRLQAVSAAALIPSDKFLIDGGIIEMSSAGYLPVAPNSVVSVNEQVRRLLGKGVDLRFCIVRPDFVAHALEEAQHMERISLLQGLDDPKNKPKVDILVPNGEIIEQKLLSPGFGFEASLLVNPLFFSDIKDTNGPNPTVTTAVTLVPFVTPFQFQGAARAEQLPSGGGAVYLGAELEARFVRVASAVGAAAEAGAAAAAPRGTSFLGTFSNVNSAVATKTFRPGAWVSLLCEQNILVSRPGDKANFNAHAVVATTEVRNTPMLDIELNGIVEITQPAIVSGGARKVIGHIDDASFSFLAFGNPGPRQTIHVDLDVTVTLTANTIEIVLIYQKTPLKLTANWDKQPLEVTASIMATTKDSAGAPQDFIYAAALLKENADVLSASSANHQQALAALETVAAALRDLNFAAAKARLLFPPPPAPTDEILVRATHDWVLFHRRRDKQCSAVVEVPPAKSPETYRIFDITHPSLDEARATAVEITDELANDLPAFARRINRLADSAVDLVIPFAGDSSQPLFDFTEADAEWQRLNPGKLIANVFYGSRHDDNVALQTNRLRQFESAISNHSQEDPSFTVPQALVPFPAEARPPDADGIMLFVTAIQVKTALLYTFGREFGPVSPHGKVLFRDSKPQQTDLDAFVSALIAFRASATNVPGIRYIWVASTSSSSDADAAARGKAIRERLQQGGLAVEGITEEVVQVASLSPAHKEEIKNRLNDPSILEGIDDVILLEFATERSIVSPASQVSAKVEKIEALDPPTRGMRLKLTITNSSKSVIQVGEFFTAAIRFLEPTQIKPGHFYPIDLLNDGMNPPSGLQISDNHPWQPSETRTVEAVAIAADPDKWIIPAQPFIGGLLFCYEPDGREHIMPVVS